MTGQADKARRVIPKAWDVPPRADGVYHPTWSPAGKDPKVDPPGKRAEARRLTRVRRLRYYPVRITDGTIEVAIPG